MTQSIGPFSTYSPPGTYVTTLQNPVLNQILGGLRVPVLIGVAQQSLTQTNFELIRGSSSVADTPVYGEDPTGQFVLSGTNTQPTLGNANGVATSFRVRNYPIVDGSGQGKITYDTTKVSVTVNNNQAVVTSVDGAHGIIQLLIPPQPTDIISVNYYFHRGDTRITDNLSAQVTTTPAVLVAPKAETYNIIAGVNDQLILTIDDVNTVTIQLVAGPTQPASDVAQNINAAAVTDLTASVFIDNQGLNHVQMVSQGNILVGSGTANGALGFNPGQYTGRNKVFTVFNGPIVDGSGGGITTTDPSLVTVMVNSQQVLASAVNGLNQTVTLPFAPKPNSVVAITYAFNTWQDTFDYLPNSNVLSVTNCGIGPGRSDYNQGPDFVVVNNGEQSTIQWGTAFTIAAGVTTGQANFDSTVINGLLVDNQIFATPLTNYTDPSTNTVSTTTFVLPLTPTTGNGRDTPLGQSLYQTITNGRIDLPTNRPDLVIVYVGTSLRDALAHPPVQVNSVDSSTGLVTLANPVPSTYLAFATFYYNTITEDVFTLSVQTVGPSGVGQYQVSSQATGGQLYNATFGTVSGLSTQVQWPSGIQNQPDAFLTGAGSPVSETVTIQFLDTLDPAYGASFTNANPSPYDLYTYSQNFGGVVIDGNTPVTINLGEAFPALLVGAAFPNPTSLVFRSTDYLAINIDGINIAPIPLASYTSIAQVVAAINAAVVADVQVHKDGTGTFASTPSFIPATYTSFLGGAEAILQINGRNVQSSYTSGLFSNVTCITPVAAGATNGAPTVGLQSNETSSGSFNALDQPAQLIGTNIAPYNISTGVNDNLQLNVDGNTFGVTIPGGAAVSLETVVDTINDAYLTVASPADIATMTTSLIAVVNNLRTKYNAHIGSAYSSGYHLYLDSMSVSTVTNNGGLFEVTTTTAIPFPTGSVVSVTGVVGTGGMPAAINTTWTVTVLDGTHFTLNGSVFVGAYSSAGTITVTTETLTAAVDLTSAITLVNDITSRFNVHIDEATAVGGGIASVTASGSLIEITTNTAHGLITGALVVISGVIGVPANDTWLVTVSGADTFTLQFSAFSGSYTSGGVVSVQTHQFSDTINGITLVPAVSLQTAIALAAALQQGFNAHLIQQGVHGYPDYINIETDVNQVGGGISGITTIASTSDTITTNSVHGLVPGNIVYITGSQDTTINGLAFITQTGTTGSTIVINNSAATGSTYPAGGIVQDGATIQTLLNDAKAKILAHMNNSGVPVFHEINDTVNYAALNAVPAASDPVSTLSGTPAFPTMGNLANGIKQYLNAHFIQAGVHVVNDVTNTIDQANATSSFVTIVPLVDAIAYLTTFGAFNAHRNQTEGLYSVHGTFDAVDTSTLQLSNLVASSGVGQNVGELVLTSRVNTPLSQLAVLQTSTANTALGFISGISATRTQPTSTLISTALNNNSGFGSLAVAYDVYVQGLGHFIEILSRSVGSSSTIAFTNVANSAFVPDAGLGIVPGTSGGIGENSLAGYQVTSSAGALGSHGVGFPGQTYTDTTTGLRFSVLPANRQSGYDNGGTFTLNINTIFTCDGAIPTNAIPGMQTLVYNTLNMAPGTTGVVSTYPHKGAQPAIGDVYYISYQYGKTDLSPALFRDLKTIQMNFGPPTPAYPLSLAASLALLNGTVIIGLSQVLTVPGQSQASDASYTAAIDVLRSNISGTVKADIITPLTNDPTVFTYLNQHCIFMSSPRQQGERMGVVGVAVGTTPTGVALIAQGLGSELMIVVYPDSFIITVTDANNNSTEQLIDGSFCAAALAGSTCNPAIDVATPLTRRSIIGFTSLGTTLDPTTANQVAVSGVTIIDQVTSGLRIRQGLTTNLATVITRTPSVTLTIQYVQQTMRNTLDPFIGNKLVNSTVTNINNQVTGMFGQLIDAQIVQSVTGISVAPSTTDPTIVNVEAIYVPVFPLEYIVATLQIQVST
jgi:hypothetical protein